MIDHKALERLNFAAISSLKMMEKGKETPVELLASKMVEYMQAAHPLLILELLDFLLLKEWLVKLTLVTMKNCCQVMTS